jgi:hypothetical protein
MSRLDNMLYTIGLETEKLKEKQKLLSEKEKERNRSMLTYEGMVLQKQSVAETTPQSATSPEEIEGCDRRQLEGLRWVFKPICSKLGKPRTRRHQIEGARGEEQRAGVTITITKFKDADDDDHTLPPEIEVQLSQLAAQAAAQLLQKNMADTQQQQNQQAAQDPLIQMQQQELEIKKQDVERKAKKDMLDAAAKADEIKLKEQQEQNRMELEGTKLGMSAKNHQTDICQTV